jgi:general secretion pathway protein J
MRTATSAGFTLLEILVALIVFGFVMVGLTQGVQFGLHARATACCAI